MGDINDLKRNGSGYHDPTAYSAIMNVVRDEDYERFHELLHAIFRLCDDNGFKIEGRVVLKDLTTGKIWR